MIDYNTSKSLEENVQSLLEAVKEKLIELKTLESLSIDGIISSAYFGQIFAFSVIQEALKSILDSPYSRKERSVIKRVNYKGNRTKKEILTRADLIYIKKKMFSRTPKAQIANGLGVSRQTIYNYLHKYKIEVGQQPYIDEIEKLIDREI